MADLAPSVLVETGARLHFGLIAPAKSTEGRRFGGVGLMIDGPPTRVLARTNAGWSVAGPGAERVSATIERWQASTGGALRGAHVEVLDAPEPHAGWGSGTQLAAAVATALEQLAGRAGEDAIELARLSGRGERSAIGLHGFLRGGLIAEPGKLPHEIVAPLGARIALPEDWRFVLLTPVGGAPVAGPRERAFFATLAAAPNAAQELRDIVERELLPAAREADFPGFSRALGRFNHGSGALFSAVQGGAYASGWHARQVAWLAERGIWGAGQSSWGPTLFAAVESQDAAEPLAADWAARCGREVAALVAPPLNRGRKITWIGGDVETRSQPQPG